MNALPYLASPYKSRQWGNNWHSLCSYQGKLKPSIAYFLIKNFTNPGETVLDPMCGVGTIPFEASLQGRIGIGNDLSNLAFVVTKAKLGKPSKADVLSVIEVLENYIENFKENYNNSDSIPYKNFGLNKKIPEYFHLDTFSEIIAARDFFQYRIKDLTEAECMVFSAFLHVLHGNRPYALSRKSHPLTPYAPTGDCIYKNVVEHIKRKVELNYKQIFNENFIKGIAMIEDMFLLPKKLKNIDIIITSPPFINSLNFYQSNWMRLWLTGWEPDDFKNVDKNFIEVKQKKGLEIYDKYFETAFKILKPGGKMILHLGKSNHCDMGKELMAYAEKYFDIILKGDEDVSLLENHGIRDKGGTTSHQFLFLMRR
ncbi:TPA: hypothetical protein PDX13_000319 [Staphylococcus aureus]|uniref:hypothetical protein n=1 Tax=Staphylococcus epidermidis TaxID=1282 RepID=UPI001F4660C3|nr:hypothetical protein [Staphylococcus epidermidis]HDE3574042.1 hypothetical protein [Staphylococcus aureus]MCE5044851.1 hypothetical protein [Staphylococcus epidermidis]MCO6329068.1 hypothetical protein [Staphylococcus epidermidis]UJF04397.1 hypothetical protein KB232_00145 [Staphylococcus epidermidis]HDE3721612.1 hypothetical protein [Staphylococcus aureus]